MTGSTSLAAALLALGVAAAAAAAPSKPAPKARPATSDKAVRQLVQDCDAHKFETVVTAVVDGQPQQSKVKLCGKNGQSDAEWIGTLKDAIAKLNANSEVAPEVRDQIIAALKSEIARLDIQKTSGLGPGRAIAERPVLQGISPLPPLPLAKQAENVPLPPPRPIVPAAPVAEYAALPPLPTTPVAPPHVLAGGVTASAPMLSRPKMSLTCFDPGQAEGPCTGFTRDTLLTVHADEDLPPGTSLRFVRDGNARADLDLAQLRKGKALRFNIPTDVCRHAVGGRLELRIIRAGQEVGSEGPFNLSC